MKKYKYKKKSNRKTRFGKEHGIEVVRVKPLEEIPITTEVISASDKKKKGGKKK